jgi:hypothetical protein
MSGYLCRKPIEILHRKNLHKTKICQTNEIDIGQIGKGRTWSGWEYLQARRSPGAGRGKVAGR